MRHLTVLLALFAAACGRSHSDEATPPKHGGGGPPIAIAVVYTGWEIWIGNEKVVPADDDSRYLGALGDLEASLTGLDRRVPSGSVGTAISFDISAQIRVPMGDVAQLAALGTEKDYFNKRGSNLVAGVELGLQELGKTTAPKKVLIVLGDGNDTNNGAAKPQLAKLQARAASEHVAVYGIVYKTALSDPGNVVSALVPELRMLSSSTELPVAFGAILADCCKP